jgi:sialidase-1
MRSLFAFAAVSLAGLCLAPAFAAEPTHDDVFTSGQEGYHTFRIPALLVVKPGHLLAICEGRKTSANDAGDIDLVAKRSTDGGQTWGPLQVVYEEGGDAKVAIGNPCPVVDSSTGVIWLPFNKDNDRVLVTHSADGGATWAKPRDITADVKLPAWTWYATGPGVGIELQRGPHKGRLVIPCDHREPGGPGTSEKAPSDKPAAKGAKAPTYSHVFYSDDHGQTWKLGGTAAPHTNECQVVELADGKLSLNMRNYWGRDGGQAERDRLRAVAESADGGATWGELRFDSTLIEPTCQAGYLRFSWPVNATATNTANAGGKSRLVFTNPASRTTRDKLTIRLSYDEGRTWPVSKLLCEGASAYSSPAALTADTLGVLYERDKSQKITLATCPLTWLEASP